MLEQALIGHNPKEVLQEAIDDELDKAAVKWFKDKIADKYIPSKEYGHLYQVEIPDADVMLDEDLPLRNCP